MIETPFTHKFLLEKFKLDAKDKLQLRLEIRNFIEHYFKENETCKNFTDLIFKATPINPDLVGSLLRIEFKEGALNESCSAKLAYNEKKGFDYLVIVNTLIDDKHHKRFSKFHECSHVLFKLFEKDCCEHRSPMSIQPGYTFYKEPKETVCDIAASEMLFYYPLFKDDLETIDVNKDLCKQILDIASKYEASLEATIRMVVENLPRRAFMLAVQENYRADEQKLINDKELAPELLPVPKPRISYSIINPQIEFTIKKNKSFNENTTVYKSYYEKSHGCEIIDVSTISMGAGTYKLASFFEFDKVVCLGIEMEMGVDS